MINKIANVTVLFWITKICATTIGETAGDFLSMTLNVGYGLSSLILLSFFLIVLIIQFFSKRFHPVLYWTVVLATSTAGTTISDFIDRTLGFGYATGSALVFVCLVCLLFAWHYTTGTISVTRITDSKNQMFYWLVVLISNTLGTALGDYLADSSGLGYVFGNLLISTGILFIILAYYNTSISRTILFWLAFVLTRPFGATMGDILTKIHEKGGLGYGTCEATFLLMIALFGLIILQKRAYRVKSETNNTLPPVL